MKNEPNIAMVGTKPLKEVSYAGRIILMPEPKEQAKPFYHAEANLLCRLFPDTYKPVRKIGDK